MKNNAGKTSGENSQAILMPFLSALFVCGSHLSAKKNIPVSVNTLPLLLNRSPEGQTTPPPVNGCRLMQQSSIKYNESAWPPSSGPAARHRVSPRRPLLCGGSWG